MALVLVHVMMSTHYISVAGGLHPTIGRKHETFGRPHVLPMFATFLVVCIAFSIKIATQMSPAVHRFFYKVSRPSAISHQHRSVAGAGTLLPWLQPCLLLRSYTVVCMMFPHKSSLAAGTAFTIVSTWAKIYRFSARLTHETY